MTTRRRFSAYLAGATAARIGDEMAGPALLLMGLAVTGSPASASALPAGLTISAAAGGPVFGALLDRTARPGRMLAAALVAYAAGLALIVGLVGITPVVVGVVVAVSIGLFAPAFSAGWTAQVPRVVPANSLRRATALDVMTFDLAGLLGPLLAGSVAAVAGGPIAVVAAAVLIAAAFPFAWTLPIGSSPPTISPRTISPRTISAGPVSPGPVVANDLLAGLRAIGHSAPLLRATVVSAVSLMGTGMLVVSVPLLGRDIFGNAGLGVLLLGLRAGTALGANALLARCPWMLRADTIIWTGCLVLAGALGLAATRDPAMVIVAAAVAGIADGPALTALFVVRHRDSPPRLRGQVFSTGASLKITGFAIGTGLAGPIVAWSVSGALLTGAALQLLAVACFAALSQARSSR